MEQIISDEQKNKSNGINYFPNNFINKIENDNVDLKKFINVINVYDKNIKTIKGIDISNIKNYIEMSNLNENKEILINNISKNILNNKNELFKENNVMIKVENFLKYELKNDMQIYSLNNLKENENKHFFLNNKINLIDSKISKSLTDQLYEEFLKKLAKIYLFKSYLETFVYEKNPYIMNFIYVKDNMCESKNRVLNSLILSAFSNLLWGNEIYKHEYLLSKEMIKKYLRTLEKIPDNNKYSIIPVMNLENIKDILNEQEKKIKLLKQKKFVVKKNNENLLFILSIIKKNFYDIKTKAQKVIKKILFRLDLLNALFILKNDSHFSNKYSYNKVKLIHMLELFNSLNIDNKIQKINKAIKDINRNSKNFQKDSYCDGEYKHILKNVLEKNRMILTQMKSTTSEIFINIEENKECSYQLNLYENNKKYMLNM